jgi:hypothetical protein
VEQGIPAYAMVQNGQLGANRVVNSVCSHYLIKKKQDFTVIFTTFALERTKHPTYKCYSVKKHT